MKNPYSLISQILEEISNRRTQDVIRRRFGLHNGQSQTLQEIGDYYKITRERVRQIENNGLGHLSQSKIQSKIKPVEEMIYDYLKEHGELRREPKLLDDLVYVCFPVTQVQQMLKGNNEELNRCRAALNLILTLGQPFQRIGETEDFHPVWTVDKNSLQKAKKTVDSAIKHFNQKKQVLKDAELLQAIKNNLSEISDKAVFSYIDASKMIDQNAFGEFGLIDWPEISPRGVRDKAYLVFKKEKKPMHFSEVTNLINQYLPDSRLAYIQTVHNELIKDQRFVLIGRGIYALSEWGYQGGTVGEVIRQILREKGPLSKEEILKDALSRRLIKENTVLINLQNKKIFRKLDDGRFTVV